MGVSEDTKRMENSGNPGRRTTQEVHKHTRGRGVIGNIALGMTDGLVTNLAFLAGFAGANYGVSVIRLQVLQQCLLEGCRCLSEDSSRQDLKGISFVRTSNVKPTKSNTSLKKRNQNSKISTSKRGSLIKRRLSWLRE